MAPGDETRRSPASGQGDFDGRDLLVGRPEGAVEGRPAAEAADVPPATPTPQPAEPSPQPAAHDDAIREILATVQATAARIDALQDEQGPARETAKELARETAALTEAVAGRARRARQGSGISLAPGRGGGDSAAPWPGPQPR